MSESAHLPEEERASYDHEPTDSDGDGFFVRVVIDTADVGPEPGAAVEWVMDEMRVLLAKAPFHVGGLVAYAVSDVVVDDA